MILTSDCWEGVYNHERVHHLPKWGDVETSICRLDGKICTLVTLDDERGSNLFIGGGPSGLVVAFSKGNEHLIARQGDEGEAVLIIVGGQAGEYRKRNVIPLQNARNIAEAFFQGIDVQSFGQWEQG
jgi:hypothetical protein